MKKTGYIADRTIFQNLRKRLNKIAKNSVLQANAGENLPSCYSDLIKDAIIVGAESLQNGMEESD